MCPPRLAPIVTLTNSGQYSKISCFGIPLDKWPDRAKMELTRMKKLVEAEICLGVAVLR